jgi:hypothetical protein
MSPQPRYNEPFFWWGPSGISPPSLSIGDLLRDGTLDLENASVLWAALARQSSLAVIAGPSGAGKTTLLTALLEFLPPDMQRLYLRGCFESFSFFNDPAVTPTGTALLVNEISPHLPVYLWGSAVSRLLDAAERGFTVLATAHAETVPEFVGLLTGSPLRIPAMRVAAFEFVVVMDHSTVSQGGGRVRDVWRLCRRREGVSIAAVDLNNSSDELLQPDAFPRTERQRRRDLLIDLRDGQIDRLPVLGARAEAGA